MYNKKAVSDVVSTVLIILLVVAAVAIVGAIILRVVTNAGPQVDYAVQCLSLDIKPTSCVITTGVSATVIVERGAGGSDVLVEKITVYPEAAGVSLLSKDVTPVPTSIGTGSATLTSITGLDKVKVAAKITGNSNYCSASTTINCA